MIRLALNILQDPKLYQYVIVGGLSAIVDISLFLVFNKYLPYHYLVSATISFVIATLFNYTLCNLFVFRSSHKHSNQKKLFLVYLVSGIGLLIHHSVLFFTFEGLFLPIAYSKILAMGTAFGWNFLSRKHLVFVTH